jgi:Phage integrase, N-terminal SAM-like domain
VDAERFLVAIEDAKLRGAYVDQAAGRVPFAEWAERWERTTATLRPSTRKDYATLLKNQVLPAFGDMTLVASTCRPTPACGRVSSWRSRWAVSICCGGGSGWPRPPPRSPGVWSGRGQDP